MRSNTDSPCSRAGQGYPPPLTDPQRPQGMDAPPLTPRSLRSSGVSLVEVLVCAFILATLSAIAIPPLNSLVERHRVDVATHILLQNLALTRATAVSRRSTTALCPTLNGSNCLPSNDWSDGWILFLDRDGNRHPDAPANIVHRAIAPVSRHLQLRSSAGRQQVRYLPDGRSAGSNLTISICNKKGRLLGSVVVNNAGRARSARPKTATTCPGGRHPPLSPRTSRAQGLRISATLRTIRLPARIAQPVRALDC